MQSIKTVAVAIASLGLLFLGACGSNNPTTPSANIANKSTETTSNSTAVTPSPEPGKDRDGHEHKDGDSHTAGGQVIESGDYHLEFLSHKSDRGVDLDFFLEKEGSHQFIASAKVTAQVQFPDGSEKAVEMNYNTVEKAYTATLPNPVPGEYKVAIRSDIDGKKIMGRFSFKQ